MRIGLRYDMRAPDLGPGSATSSQLFSTAVEQARWADSHGIGTIYLAEHHGAADGYCPSPIVLATAMAAATSRVVLHFSALCVTFYHPLKLAEDLAVLDLIAGPGRVEVTAGMGYRPSEYEMFGIDFDSRAARFEDTLHILQGAWRGDEVEYGGVGSRVTPLPVTPGGPRMFIAGSARPSARRAARLGIGYRPATADLYSYYEEQCAAAGISDVEPFPEHGPAFLFVTEDPERDWHTLAPHLMYATNSYAQWAKERTNAPQNGYWQNRDDLEALKADPSMWVVTPDELLRRCAALPVDYELRMHPLLGGIDPEVSWRSLELFADKVLPELTGVLTFG